MEQVTNPPILLKSRVKHSWIAALGALFVVLFAAPIDHSYHEIIEWMGYPLLIAAVIGRMWCSMYVGGRKNAEVIATGPYSIVRNPLYVFSFLGIVGVGFVSGMITFALLLALAFVLYYPNVVAREEKFLEQKFGQPYRDYKSRVPGWLPNFKLWQSPDVIEIKPRFVLITFRDAVWFLLAYPILELIESAQMHGYLPVLFRLY